MKAYRLFASTLLLGSVASAQTISVEPAECIPKEDNGLVRATAAPQAGQSARLYFRWKDKSSGDKAFYWVPLEPEANGRLWGTPPKPEKRNSAVEYYGALVDPTGKTVARSQTLTSPVRGDCRVKLNTKERGVAENLTVGETSPDQQGREVLAFLCDGIVTRVNFAGLRRSDDVCRACVVAWRRGIVVPALAAGLVGVIVTDEEPEPSPSRP
jgi:hypothetical protein